MYFKTTQEMHDFNNINLINGLNRILSIFPYLCIWITHETPIYKYGMKRRKMRGFYINYQKISKYMLSETNSLSITKRLCPDP